MKIKVVISDSTNPFLNLAVEERLMDCTEDDAILYLWRNDRTVVIGANQNPWTECNINALAEDGGCFVRRRSGGGAVYHDIGNLNFSFIVKNEIYNVRRQLNVIARALKPFGIVADISGRNDLTTDGRKFSGNAFLQTKTTSLHHGTILIRVDVASMTRYLTPAKEKLGRKGVKNVQSRVINLAEINHAITAEALIPELVNAFSAEYEASCEIGEFSKLVEDPSTKAMAEKYAGDEWLFAKWREEQTMNVRRRIVREDGLYDISMHVSDGKITAAAVASDSLDVESTRHIERTLISASEDAIKTLFNKSQG